MEKESKIVLRERYKLLRQIEHWLELPIVILGIIWLILLIVEFIFGLTPVLNFFILFIWGLFIIDFLLRFFLAPDKLSFIKSNWLTALSLIVPALRVFRIFYALRILRIARAARGIRVFRVISSVNRALKAFRKTFRRRGFGYVLIITVIITFTGAAAMYNLENGSEGFRNFSDSLWWTAMMMTTLGSGFWPQTFEGRVLAFFLSLYAFTVFGYVTATIASYFIERDAGSNETEIAGQKTILALQKNILELTEEIKKLNRQA